MHEISDLVGRFGVAFAFVNVFLQQLGLPVPVLPTLLVAGALAAHGRLSGLAVLGATVAACAIANAGWYAAGRRYGDKVMRMLCRVSISPDSCVRQTEVQFERWGTGMLVFAKFIPLVATIAPPLAGALHVGWPTFLFLNTLGAGLFCAAGIGAGLLLHEQIGEILARLEDMGRLGALLLGVLVAGYVSFKYFQRRRLYKRLRMARITVDDLYRLMAGDSQPTIVDVRSPGARARDGRRIPGALLLDPGELDKHIDELSNDRDIVLYCTCPNEASAAHIAKLLMNRGFTRVRPLLGGLEAWIAAGFSVENLSEVDAGRSAASIPAQKETPILPTSDR